MVSSVWPLSLPHWNVTWYTEPALASASIRAVADDWPLGMVTVSKTSEETLAAESQLSAVSRRRPPAAMLCGCTLKPNEVMLLLPRPLSRPLLRPPSLFPSPFPARAAVAERVRAVAPSSAAEATRIACMVSLRVPEEPCCGPSACV
jgi:hypothetical protein